MKRQRAVSNLFEGENQKNIVENLLKYTIYSEKSREDFYYPDKPKSIEINYDTTGVLDDMQCINDILKSKFHESFNINKHQSLIKYEPKMKSKYKNEFGLWQPKGHLVTTINDYSASLNSIKSVDVSMDSEYWATISNSKFYLLLIFILSYLYREHKNVEH